MKKCIYLKKGEPELTFSAGEHIIPAGIGGMKKLPIGLVCDKVNKQIFSALELKFMRDSLISLPRQFHGPGKRGKLTLNKATKSKIHLLESVDNEEKLGLGYIKLAKPYSVPQFKVAYGKKAQFTFAKSDGNIKTQISTFINNLKEFDGKYIEINDDRIPEKNLILGIDNKKWYLGKNSKYSVTNLKEIIAKVINSAEIEAPNPEYITSQITSKQSLNFDINNEFRVYAKIVFNFLAFAKGQDFVLQEEFDSIRNWIVNGGENEFVSLIDKEKEPDFLKRFPFPDLSHSIFITKIDNNLIGVLSFYRNQFQALIKLSSESKVNGSLLEGYICDWQNQIEYSFLDYIKKLTTSTENT